MRRLKLLSSFLAIPWLTLLVSGCGGGNTIGHTAQTITFTNPGTQTAGTSQALSANASSDVAVILTSATLGVCTVSGTTATFVTAGTCTIDASQSGNSTYAAASQVAQSFTVNPAIGPNITIYVAGYAISTASSPSNVVNVAEIWQLKSGSPTATATALPTPSGITSSQADAITISGSDVYVAGTTSNGANQTAVYWLNHGPAITLPSSMAISQTNAIAVSDGNVYIAGYEENGVANGNAVLWVNGAHTMLPPPPGKAYAGASAVMVSGGNVYVAGIAFNNDNDESAVLWVNGVPTILPPPAGLTGDYFANGLAISAGTIYVSGSTIPSVGNSTALFWVNGGAATALPVPPNDSAGNYGAGAITVSGSDVYVAGAGSNGTTGDTSAAYWMNGAATTLPMPNAFANPSDGTSSTSEIALSGSDVYAAGWLVDSTDGVAQTAAYWVNGGEATLLPMPSGTYESWASAIAVATQ